MGTLLRRQPHPIRSPQQAYENARRICEPRGHHGPFINELYYCAFPGWEGYGDCVVCCSTVLPAFERALAPAEGLTAATAVFVHGQPSISTTYC
jgi:hypothetical protein